MLNRYIFVLRNSGWVFDVCIIVYIDSPRAKCQNEANDQNREEYLPQGVPSIYFDDQFVAGGCVFHWVHVSNFCVGREGSEQ